MSFKTMEQSEFGAKAFGIYENSNGMLHTVAFFSQLRWQTVKSSLHH